MKNYWKVGLIIAMLLNIIAYIKTNISECFTAFCSLAIIYVIFMIDEKNREEKTNK